MSSYPQLIVGNRLLVLHRFGSVPKEVKRRHDSSGRKGLKSMSKMAIRYSQHSPWKVPQEKKEKL